MKKYILFIGIVLFGIHFSTHAENDTTQLSHQINHVLKFIKYNEEKPVEQRKYIIPEDDFILKRSANDGNLNGFVDNTSSAYLELVEELKQFNQSYDKDNFSLYVFYGRYFLSYEELLKGFDFDVKYTDRLKDSDRKNFLNDVKTLRGNKKTQDIYTWKLTRQIKDSLNAKYPSKRICILWLVESYYLKRDGLDANGVEKREVVRKKGYYKNISYLNLNERIALSELKYQSSQVLNEAVGNAMDLLSLTKNAINILNNVKTQALTSGEWCPKCPPEKDSRAFDMYSIPKGGGLFDLYMFFEVEYGGIWIRVEENAKITAKENNWYMANGDLNMEDSVAVLQETLETLAQELAFRDYSDLKYYYGEAYAQSKEYYYRDYYLKAQFLLLEELINQKIATDVGWLGYVPVIADDAATAYYSWQISKQLPARLASIINKLKADAAINAFSAITDVIGGFKNILKIGLRKSFGKKTIKKTIKNQGLFDASTTVSKISREGKFSKFSSYLVPIRQIAKQRDFDGKTLEEILNKAGEQVWEYLNNQSPEQIEKIFQKLPTQQIKAVEYLKDIVNGAGCDNFASLRPKALAAGMSASNIDAAIAKLCTIPNADTRQAVNNKLISYSDNEVKAFLEDVNRNDEHSQSLSKNLSRLTPEIVGVWAFVNKHQTDKNYQRDFGVLLQVEALTNAIKNDAQISDLIKGDDSSPAVGLASLLTKNRYAPCVTCTDKASYLDNLDKYLESIRMFAAAYKNIKGTTFIGTNFTTRNNYYQGGAKRVISDLKSDDRYTVEGAAFGVRTLRNETRTVKGFEVYMPDATRTKTDRVADVVLQGNNGLIVVDFKSWKEATLKDNFKVGKDKYNQFLSYVGFAGVQTLDNLEYWFDEGKIERNTLKKTFQDIWLQNGNLTQEGEALFETIWQNTRLRESLFGVIPPDDLDDEKPNKKQDFTVWVNKLDNRIFNFIKVK